MQQTLQPLTDGELERLAAAGERDAFGELYERHADRVYDFLLRMVRDPEAAADLMQETFIRAMNALSTEKAGGAAFSTWVFTIARNQALTWIERNRRTVSLVEEAEDDAEEPHTYQYVDTDQLADPQAAAEARDMAGLVWEAAAALEPKQYSLLDLHIRQGLDSAEIAEVLGVSKGNAYTMLSRLRDTFEEAVASLVMFQRGRRHCPELNRLIEEYRFEGVSASARKLIMRHISECTTCQEQRRQLVSAETILRSLVPLPLPLILKQQVAQAATQAGPTIGAASAKVGILKSLWGQSGGRLAQMTSGWKMAASGVLLMAVAGGSVGGWLLAVADGGSDQAGRWGVASPLSTSSTPIREVAPVAAAPAPTTTPTLPPTAMPTAAAKMTVPPPLPPPGPLSPSVASAAPPLSLPTPTPLPPTPQLMPCPAPLPQPQLPPGYGCSEITAAPFGESEGFNLRLEQSIIQLENHYRATLGLPPLQYDARLEQAAKGFAKQLVDNGWIHDLPPENHTGPDGRTLMMRVADVGLVHGENLYWVAEDHHWGVNGANVCRVFSNLTAPHLRNITADCLYGAPSGPYYGVGCYFRYEPQLQFVCVVDYAALQ